MSNSWWNQKGVLVIHVSWIYVLFGQWTYMQLAYWTYIQVEQRRMSTTIEVRKYFCLTMSLIIATNWTNLFPNKQVCYNVDWVIRVNHNGSNRRNVTNDNKHIRGYPRKKERRRANLTNLTKGALVRTEDEDGDGLEYQSVDWAPPVCSW